MEEKSYILDQRELLPMTLSDLKNVITANLICILFAVANVMRMLATANRMHIRIAVLMFSFKSSYTVHYRLF